MGVGHREHAHAVATSGQTCDGARGAHQQAVDRGPPVEIIVAVDTFRQVYRHNAVVADKATFSTLGDSHNLRVGIGSGDRVVDSGLRFLARDGERQIVDCADIDVDITRRAGTQHPSGLAIHLQRHTDRCLAEGQVTWCQRNGCRGYAVHDDNGIHDVGIAGIAIFEHGHHRAVGSRRLGEDDVGVEIFGSAVHNAEGIVQRRGLSTRLHDRDVVQAYRLARQIEGGKSLVVAVVLERLGLDGRALGIGERHLHVGTEPRAGEHYRYTAGVATLIGGDIAQFERQDVGLDGDILVCCRRRGALQVDAIVACLGGGDVEFGIVDILSVGGDVVVRRIADVVMRCIEHVRRPAGRVVRPEVDADGLVDIGIDDQFVVVHHIVIEHIGQRRIEGQLAYGEREGIGRAGGIVVVVHLVEHVAHVGLDNHIVITLGQSSDAGGELLLHIATGNDIYIVVAHTAQQTVVGIEHSVGRKIDQAAQAVTGEGIGADILHTPGYRQGVARLNVATDKDIIHNKVAGLRQGDTALHRGGVVVGIALIETGRIVGADDEVHRPVLRQRHAEGSRVSIGSTCRQRHVVLGGRAHFDIRGFEDVVCGEEDLVGPGGSGDWLFADVGDGVGDAGGLSAVDSPVEHPGVGHRQVGRGNAVDRHRLDKDIVGGVDVGIIAVGVGKRYQIGRRSVAVRHLESDIDRIAAVAL